MLCLLLIAAYYTVAMSSCGFKPSVSTVMLYVRTADVVAACAFFCCCFVFFSLFV